MSKKILHFKFNMEEVAPEQVKWFGESIKDAVGNDYHIVLTPFEMTTPDLDDVWNFDGINYTVKEIIEALHQN